MSAQRQSKHNNEQGGLSTRTELDAFTLASWESATAAAGGLSVLLVELDDFGRFCDNYGTEAGEVLVRRASSVIRTERGGGRGSRRKAGSGRIPDHSAGRHTGCGADSGGTHPAGDTRPGNSPSRLHSIQLCDRQCRRGLLQAAAGRLAGDVDRSGRQCPVVGQTPRAQPHCRVRFEPREWSRHGRFAVTASRLIPNGFATLNNNRIL